VRRPPTIFKRPPRHRTQAELNGLKKGNERRRLEALARRKAAHAEAECAADT
jgi:hypothetical protein